MLQNLVWLIRSNLRYNRKWPIVLRMCSKDASCGNKSPKCNSKDKPKPSCKRTRKPQDCSKKLAPYPSYSECKRKPTSPKSPSECDCLKLDK